MAVSDAISMAAFALLTGNSVVAIWRAAQGGAAAISFVVTSYATLLALFGLLRWLETAPRGSAAWIRAKAGVWVATTVLTAMFSWRVAALMPRLEAAGVWVMAASTVLGGFYTLVLPNPMGD